MKVSKSQLLHFVQCVAWLNHIDVTQDCQMIKNLTTNQLKKKTDKLAYDIGVSTQAVNDAFHKDYQSQHFVLYVASQMVTDVNSLRKYLRACYLSAGRNRRTMLKNTDLTYEQFINKLNNHSPFLVKQINTIAYNIYAPDNVLKETFQKAHIKVYKNLNKILSIVKKTDTHTNLINYIKCVARIHDTTFAKLAKMYHISYVTLYNHLKNGSKEQIIKQLSKLCKTYKELSPQIISQILSGNDSPINCLSTQLRFYIHDRQSCFMYIKLYAQLRNLSITDVAKALHHKSTYFHSIVLRTPYNDFKNLIKKIVPVLNMGHNEIYLILHQPGLRYKVNNLPKKMAWRVGYVHNPMSYQPTMPLPKMDTYPPYLAIKHDIANLLKTQLNVKKSIKLLSKQYGFNFNLFIKDNFKVATNHNKQIIYVKQSKHDYPVISFNNWQQLFKSIQVQLMNIQKKTSIKDIKKSKYAPYIHIKGASMKPIQIDNSKVKKFDDHHRHIFTATFEHTDVRTIPSKDDIHKEFYRPILVLSNIKHGKTKVLPQATLNYTKVSIKLGQLCTGDKIKVSATVSKRNGQYNLSRPMWVKIIHKANQRKRTTVPTEIHALLGYAIENNKTESYDFTTWGHNYGYVRYCKHMYKKWLNSQAIEKGNQHD